MVAIATSSVTTGTTQSKAAVTAQAPTAPRPVIVRRFSPSSIAAVVASFAAVTGLLIGTGIIFAEVITKVLGGFAGL
ncbi:hypothetical protein V5R04_10830 [Jonesiaceae bacterium BS-20]|uniref:Uncharacterized protein n=1 Tax=Jonesiaceae bacterium BS-20 TaxID=3120821 RepID=A0AAU7DUH5_9MICO